MRRFLVLAHHAPLTPSFPLDDLPGSAGRLDVLCRCLIDGLLTSHGIREETTVEFVLQDQLTVRFAGDTIRNLRPDERSTAAHFRRALERAEAAVGRVPVDVSPGITVIREDLAAVLDRVDSPIIWLDPAGDPLVDLPPRKPVTFVLSDHRPYTDADVETLTPRADNRMSCSPVTIQAAQAITVVHNYLDTAGYERF